MYCVVRLKQSKIKLALPNNWIKGFNDVQTLNHGIKVHKKHIVFYSGNKYDEPDFNLNVVQTFHRHLPSLYEANMCKFFGKYRYFSFFSVTGPSEMYKKK